MLNELDLLASFVHIAALLASLQVLFEVTARVLILLAVYTRLGRSCSLWFVVNVQLRMFVCPSGLIRRSHSLELFL